eukprot:CAMPEP_0172720352 /NCGR_PEP_ID=MMETSP1074-20121228/76702_1 /TAXON_ID=2916 /ORGANISM="Ceratium fusus, Strain PA161109" /LENGTH=53 /DNA_ID=CAMNT_0013545855 /DNA_START=273 /DNA_END=434 /DNA_ORIENTATION=+
MSNTDCATSVTRPELSELAPTPVLLADHQNGTSDLLRVQSRCGSLQAIQSPVV